MVEGNSRSKKVRLCVNQKNEESVYGKEKSVLSILNFHVHT
jgi:hypothetical protein